jgi:hypothetical protein
VEINGYVLSQYALYKFADYAYGERQLIDYHVCVSKGDGFSVITVTLLPAKDTRADVALLVYSAKLSSRVEVTEWLLDQAMGQIFGNHDKRITSIEYC